MQYIKFIKTFFISTLAVLLFISSFNLFMDPQWTFSHTHSLNNMQGAPNERAQKSHVLYFQNEKYDALLLGSSRITFFNHHDFNQSKTFNYAFSLAMPSEYSNYINFAKKQQQEAFKTIYIGIDFFGSNANFKNDINAHETLDKIESCCYKYRLLFSIDSFKTAFFSLKSSLSDAPGYRSYSRDLVTKTTQKEKESVFKRVRNQKVNTYMGEIEHYHYNDKFKALLHTLKDENPNTHFVIFTTPTSAHYLQTLFDLGHRADYERWLRELVAVFGEVYHFMDFNTITNDYGTYFFDYHHLYPRYTTMIVARITGQNNPNTPKDFGKILTKENIDNYLKQLP